jgi:hypothetical protein
MLGRGRKELSNLLRDRRILISDKAERNILDMPRAKRRSLIGPLSKIIRAQVDALEKLLFPCFTFGTVPQEAILIGGVIRRETIMLVGYFESTVQIFSAVDNDQLLKRHDNSSAIIGCWHVKKKFSVRGRVNAIYVWTIKKVMFFIARFGQLEDQKTRYVWSIEKERYMTDREIEAFMRTHDIPGDES